MSNPLFRCGEWFSGRLNPRVVYGTHTCTLLVSCIYKCTRGHQVSGTLSFGNFPCPGNDILIDIFLKRFYQNEQIYVSAMNGLSANMISCDHTFKSACNIGYKRAEDGAWINQYNSIFCILNERGEINNWSSLLTDTFPSEGFDEVKGMFMDIKEHSKENGLKLICIDNCCKWSSLLTDIFPDVSIKQDLFHAVQRFVKTLKKRDPVQRDVAADFGKIFRCPSKTY